ncbi:MAG: AMP-binding protein, partial [Lysobacter sp.]|nr:AMP-binding protein [Lysobacter sp.]
MTDQPLWTPSPERLAASNMVAFMKFLNDRHGTALADFAGLHRFSVERMEDFWVAVWDFCGVIADTRGDTVIADKGKMPGARFFPGARLNFAENLLRHTGGEGDAITFWGENRVRARLTNAELRDQVSRLQQALEAAGVKSGDRVAAFMPNMPEAVVTMLASASLGATFTSCSPDFGVQGVVDRFGQVEPKVLVCCDGYFYNGKAIETLPRIAEIVAQLPTVERVVVVPYASEKPDIAAVPRATSLA